MRCSLPTYCLAVTVLLMVLYTIINCLERIYLWWELPPVIKP